MQKVGSVRKSSIYTNPHFSGPIFHDLNSSITSNGCIWVNVFQITTEHWNDSTRYTTTYHFSGEAARRYKRNRKHWKLVYRLKIKFKKEV